MSLGIPAMSSLVFGVNFYEELEVRRWYFRWSFSQCQVGTEGMGSNIRSYVID